MNKKNIINLMKLHMYKIIRLNGYNREFVIKYYYKMFKSFFFFFLLFYPNIYISNIKKNKYKNVSQENYFYKSTKHERNFKFYIKKYMYNVKSNTMNFLVYNWQPIGIAILLGLAVVFIKPQSSPTHTQNLRQHISNLQDRTMEV